MRAQELWLPIDRMRNGASCRLVAGAWSSAAKLLRLAALLSRASAHTDTIGFVVANSEPNNISSSDNLTHFGNSIYAITGQMDLTVCVASWHSGLRWCWVCSTNGLLSERGRRSLSDLDDWRVGLQKHRKSKRKIGVNGVSSHVPVCDPALILRRNYLSSFNCYGYDGRPAG